MNDEKKSKQTISTSQMNETILFLAAIFNETFI